LSWRRTPGKEPRSRANLQKAEKHPRPRRRRGEDLHNKDPSNVRPTVGYHCGRTLYNIENLERDTNRKVGVSIKKSTRWYECLPHPSTGWHIPYYNKLGLNCGSTLYRWSCDPRQYVATVTSTVSNKLRVYAERHNSRKEVSKRHKEIVKLSFIYSVTKNKYMWDRVLFFFRNLKKYGKLLHPFSVFHLCKFDAPTRFVYSHVSLQTKWLLFRAERPRDKSTLKVEKISSSLVREKTLNISINKHIAIYDTAQAMSRM